MGEPATFLLTKPEHWDNIAEMYFKDYDEGTNHMIQWAGWWILCVRAKAEYDEHECPQMFVHGGMLMCKWALRSPDVYPTFTFYHNTREISLEMFIGSAGDVKYKGELEPEQFQFMVKEAERRRQFTKEQRDLLRDCKWRM